MGIQLTNIKHKLLKTTASIRFNSEYKALQLTPQYTERCILFKLILWYRSRKMSWLCLLAGIYVQKLMKIFRICHNRWQNFGLLLWPWNQAAFLFLLESEKYVKCAAKPKWSQLFSLVTMVFFVPWVCSIRSDLSKILTKNVGIWWMENSPWQGMCPLFLGCTTVFNETQYCTSA